MKTATIPSVRVEPALRDQVEQVLGEAETLSQFVESAVRACVRQRQNQAEFLARGARSLGDAKATGGYVDADVVLQRLKVKLESAKIRQSSASR